MPGSKRITNPFILWSNIIIFVEGGGGSKVVGFSLEEKFVPMGGC
jgi:hypothetical protein